MLQSREGSIQPYTEPLKKNEVHIWYGLVNKTQSQSEIFLEILSDEEISRYREFCFEQDKQEFLIAHFLTRQILSLYAPHILPREWEFSLNQYGKPSLANREKPSWLHFNISHSKGLVACAVSGNSQIGVDVETRERDSRYLELAEGCFSRQENEILRQLPLEIRKEYFLKIWTLKEAYIKAKGMGLTIPLESVSFSLGFDEVGVSFDPILQDNQYGWKFGLNIPTCHHQSAFALGASGDIILVERFYDNSVHTF